MPVPTPVSEHDDVGDDVRPAGHSHLLESVCGVVVLQLAAVVISLGVVTVVPAIVAVRWGIRDVLAGDPLVSLRRLLSDVRPVLVRLWPLCLAIVPLAVVFVLALLFWATRPAPVGWICAGLLCALGGSTAALLVGAIAASERDELIGRARGAVRAWLRAGVVVVVARPLRAAGCVVLLISYVLLVLRLPTVLLVGSALVPALLAVWMAGPTSARTRQDR